MSLGRDELENTLMALGEALSEDANLCLVGCAPGIFFGQPQRTTQAIEVWEPLSQFDLADLKQGCERVGLLCDPSVDVSSDAVYLRFLRPGTAAFPTSFDLDELETYRRLRLTSPTMPMLVAAMLAGASTSDIDDLVFWMGERRLTLGEIEQAVQMLPEPHRIAAQQNLVLVRLVAIDGPGLVQ